MEINKEKILSKIAKLLTLGADQDGKPEGELAKERASKLMAKHRISESEIDFGDPNNSAIIEDEDGVEGLNDKGGRRQWILDIASALSYTFDTKMYFKSWSGTVHFIGSESDVETCIYFLEIVLHHVNREARKMWPKERNWKKRNEFGTAAMTVIRNRLYEIKRHMDAQEQALKDEKEWEGGYAMVVVKKDLVKAVWEDFSDGFKNARRKTTKLTDRETWIAGQKAGETAPLNQGIGHDNHDQIT